MGTYSTSLDGISASLGVGVVEEDASWLMANALGNYAGGNADGFQLTFLLNYIEGNSSYIQLSSVGNYVNGDTTGIQTAGVGNIVGGSFQGIQNAGVVNYTAGNLDGIQTSVVNAAGNIDGIQLGVVNWAGTVDGMQMGIVNIAGDMEGVPIGLINVSKNGGIEIQGWAGGQTDFNTALVFRSGFIYTRFTAGTSTGDNSFLQTTGASARASFGLHFGARISLNRFYLDIDAGATTLDFGKSGIFLDPNKTSSEDLLSPQARAILGFSLTKRFSLFAGAGTSYPIDVSAPEDAGPFEPLFVVGTSFRIF
jgi:hypothetical protein